MKQKLKGIVSIVCIVAMMVTLFAGCSEKKDDSSNTSTNQTVKTSKKQDDSTSKQDGSNDSEDKTRFAGQEISFYMFEGGYGKEFQKDIIAKFEEEYNVKVKLTASPKLEEILRPKMATGKVPDLIIFNWGRHGIVESVFKEDGFYDLTPIFEKNALDKDVPLKDIFLPGFLESSLCAPYDDGKIYLAPMFYAGMGLVYNKTYFEQKSLTPPKTWDDFFALGEVAKADGRALYTYQGIYPSYNEILINPAIASAIGIDGFNDFTHYKEGSFKNDTVKQVLQNIQDIENKGYLMSGTVALNHTQSQTDMMRGKAMFIPNGTWMEGEMKDAPREDGFEFAMAAPPTLNSGDESYAQAAMDMIWVPKKAKNPELAAELIRYMYTNEAQRIGAEKAKGLFPIKGTLELCKDVMSESLQGMYQMFETAKPLFVNFKPLPSGSKVNVVNEIYQNNLTAVMTGERTVDEWMTNIEKIFAQAREDLKNAE